MPLAFSIAFEKSNAILIPISFFLPLWEILGSLYPLCSWHFMGLFETSFSFLLFMEQIMFSKMTIWYMRAQTHTHRNTHSISPNMLFIIVLTCLHQEGRSLCPLLEPVQTWVLPRMFGLEPTSWFRSTAEWSRACTLQCGVGGNSDNFYFLLLNGRYHHGNISTRGSFFKLWNAVTSGINMKASRCTFKNP